MICKARLRIYEITALQRKMHAGKNGLHSVMRMFHVSSEVQVVFVKAVKNFSSVY